MSICVIFNPHAGRRRAQRRLSRFLELWRDRVEFWPTEFPGHGVDLAKRAGNSDFCVVGAGGGDGTAHDVANGLLSTGPRQDLTFAVLPVGSANDYAFSVEQQFGTSTLDDSSGSLVDVGIVRTAQGVARFFIESIGLGLSGRVTLESRKIRRLQGPLLYGLAAWRAVRLYPLSELRLQWDEGPVHVCPTTLLSVLVGRREGNFLLAPHAVLDDGLFDFVHARRISNREVVWLLPRLYFRGPPTTHPEIQLGQCRTLRIQSDEPLTIHTDGEMFSTPDDAVREIEIRLLPKRLRVKVCLPR